MFTLGISAEGGSVDRHVRDFPCVEDVDDIHAHFIPRAIKPSTAALRTAGTMLPSSGGIKVRV
jgi:hypothetical protein